MPRKKRAKASVSAAVAVPKSRTWSTPRKSVSMEPTRFTQPGAPDAAAATPRPRAGFAQAGPRPSAEALEAVIGVRDAPECVQGRQARRDAQRIPRERSGLVDRTCRRDLPHQAAPPAERRQRHPTTHDLP